MHHTAWSVPGSAPHSAQGSDSAGAKMSEMSRSLLRFSARASSNRRCRPFFTGQLPRRCVRPGSVSPPGPADVCSGVSRGRRSGCPRSFPSTSAARDERRGSSRGRQRRRSGRLVCRRDGSLVAVGGRLPDLPALVRDERRRLRRATSRDRAAPRPPRLARRRRLWLSPFYRSPHGRLRLRRDRLLRRRPAVRRPRRLRPAARRRPRPRAARARRLGAEPHLRPAPVVPRQPVEPRRPQAGLVRLARRRPRHARRTTGSRRSPNEPAWTWDDATGQWYLHLFLPAAARPQLGQPRGRRGHARRHAVLARPWGRRLPHRRRPLHRQGSRPARRPARGRRHPALRPQRHATDPRAAAGDAHAGRRVPRRPDDGRRGVPPVHPAGRRVLRRRRRAAPVVQLPAAAHAVGRRAVAQADRQHARARRRARRPGRRGCCRTTTTPGTAPATAARTAPGRRRSCCSACGARPSSTPARSSGSRTPSSRPSGSSTPAAATGAGHRSRGPPPPTTAGGSPTPWLPWPPDPGHRNVEAAGEGPDVDPPPLPAAAGGPPVVASAALGAYEPLDQPGDVLAWRRTADRSGVHGPGDRVVVLNMGPEAAAVDLAGTVRGRQRRRRRGRARSAAPSRPTTRCCSTLRADRDRRSAGGRRRLVRPGLEHEPAVAVEGQGGLALHQVADRARRRRRPASR